MTVQNRFATLEVDDIETNAEQDIVSTATNQTETEELAVQTTQPTSELVDCPGCDKKFKPRGLGQHIRHRHPHISNERWLQSLSMDKARKKQNRDAVGLAEAAAPPSNEERGPKQRKVIWSEENVALLLTLEQRYEGEGGFINVEIAKSLAGKAEKQISDKRRYLRLK